MNKLHYWNINDFKYNVFDKLPYYDKENNPENYMEGNLLMILSKYNFDIGDKDLSNDELTLLKTITMCLYESTIRSFNSTLKKFILTYLIYKYGHDSKCIPYIEFYRSEIWIILDEAENSGCELLRDFVSNVLLEKDKIIHYYDIYSKTESSISNPNRDEDIEDLTNLNIFRPYELAKLLKKYNNGGDEVEKIINEYCMGGYLYEY